NITGHKSRQWHDKTAEELSGLWKAQQAKLDPEIYINFFVNESKFPTAFRLPQVYEKGSILALRISPRFVNSIVQIDSSGRVKVLVKTGQQANPHFSYAN